MRIGLPVNCEGSGDALDLRKTAVIDAELKRLNVSICGLQETRLTDEGSLKEANYTFYLRGKGVSDVREYGVGFAVRNDLLCALDRPPRGISERIMLLRLETKCGFATLISAYAPTLASTDETKVLNQYETVTAFISSATSTHVLVKIILHGATV
jgi:hypothetical protein